MSFSLYFSPPAFLMEKGVAELFDRHLTTRKVNPAYSLSAFLIYWNFGIPCNMVQIQQDKRRVQSSFSQHRPLLEDFFDSSINPNTASKTKT